MTVPRTPPDKPALTLDEQIARLRKRGMVIDDDAQARHHLGHLNYYRLRGYWMRFETGDAKQGEHRFRPGTRFEDVIRLYDFDRRLRLEINDAVERVEVSVRTQWAYQLGHHAGPIAHRDPSLFNAHHPALIDNLEILYATRNEVFLRHYLERNEEPPVWALCESLSLGDLSKWMSSIKDRKLRQLIAQPYGLNETPFCSFVQHLAYVRNLCAHHGRLWNRHLVVATLALPKKPDDLVAQLQRDPVGQPRIYNTLALLAWLLRTINPESHWRSRVCDLVATYPDLWNDMGFPDDWQRFDLWGVRPPAAAVRAT